MLTGLSCCTHDWKTKREGDQQRNRFLVSPSSYQALLFVVIASHKCCDTFLENRFLILCQTEKCVKKWHLDWIRIELQLLVTATYQKSALKDVCRIALKYYYILYPGPLGQLGDKKLDIWFFVCTCDEPMQNPIQMEHAQEGSCIIDDVTQSDHMLSMYNLWWHPKHLESSFYVRMKVWNCQNTRVAASSGNEEKSHTKVISHMITTRVEH